MSERVDLLNLNMPGKKFTVIQVYAPTEAADVEQLNIFYDTVNEAMDKAYEDFIVTAQVDSNWKPLAQAFQSREESGKENPYPQKLLLRYWNLSLTN
nr:uncharacterized protein LOC116773669 [Danaus plexippus plexippus]